MAKHVLLVDDDPNILSGEILELEMSGIEVTYLEPQEAYFAINDDKLCKYSAMIFDLLMPEIKMSKKLDKKLPREVGLALAIFARTKYYGTIAIYSGASVPPQGNIAVLRANNIHFFSKSTPLDFKRLIETIG